MTAVSPTSLFKQLLLLMVLTAGQQQAHAQAARHDSATYFQSYWHNGVDLLKKPFTWGKEGWITAGGSLVFVASMIALDEPLNVPIASWNTKFANKFGEAGDVIGGAYVQGGITSAALLVGALAKNKPITHFGLDNLQSQVFTLGLTFAFKNLSHRVRPETGEGAFKWFGPFNGWGNESFFSGHTALAFSTANMLFLHSHKKWWVGVLGFGTATAVGVSRMQQQKHWSSDVVMGAIIGSSVSSFVYHLQQRRRKALQPRTVVLP